MSNHRVSWQGSFPAIVTPFTKDGDIDEALLRANINMTIDEGAHGVVVCGHFGEAHLMNDDERDRVIAIGVEEVAGRVPAIAGTGGISTAEVIRRTKWAKEAGAVGAMIEAPYFMLTKPADTLAHYACVTDAVDLPIKVYNNPRRATATLTVDMFESLAEMANIVSIKESSGDMELVMHLIQRVGDRLRIFIGPARKLGFAAIIMGAHGFVDGNPQFVGRRAHQLYDLAMARDHEQGVPLQHFLMRCGQLIYESAGTDPATIKDAMRYLGRPGGWPRSPLRAMEGEDLARFHAALDDLGLTPAKAAE